MILEKVNYCQQYKAPRHLGRPEKHGAPTVFPCSECCVTPTRSPFYKLDCLLSSVLSTSSGRYCDPRNNARKQRWPLTTFDQEGNFWWSGVAYSSVHSQNMVKWESGALSNLCSVHCYKKEGKGTLAFVLGTLGDAVGCIDNESDFWSPEALHGRKRW